MTNCDVAKSKPLYSIMTGEGLVHIWHPNYFEVIYTGMDGINCDYIVNGPSEEAARLLALRGVKAGDLIGVNPIEIKALISDAFAESHCGWALYCMSEEHNGVEGSVQLCRKGLPAELLTQLRKGVETAGADGPKQHYVRRLVAAIAPPPPS